jgi:hypothetical protein
MAGYGGKKSTYQAVHRAELPGRGQVDSGTQ